MTRLLACCAALVCAASAAPRVAPTHEAIWLMKRVDAPSVSPDGKLVVFPVTEPAYDERNQSSDLWLVPSNGSAKPRRITATKAAESGVDWSPDSRKIAFSARRDGDEAAQIYVLDLTGGGEAIRVTSLSTGASSPKWSPDGTRLAFTSTVYPGAVDDAANRKIASERKALRYNARVYDTFPIRHWDRWLDDRRPHVFSQPAEPGAEARDLLAGTQLAAGVGFGGSLTNSGEDLSYTWTPDSKGVVFSATTVRNAAAYQAVNRHLWLASLSGGEPKQLSSGRDSFSKPAFDPAGKALFALMNREDGHAYNIEQVVRFAWPSPGSFSVVSSKLDRSVTSFEINPSGDRIFLTAEEHGHEKLFEIPAAGGQPKTLLAPEEGCYTGLAVGGSAANPVLIANFDSATSPTEVVRLEPQANRHHALSSLNAEAAARLDLKPMRHFWFTGKSGRRIHNMLVLPPGFDEMKKYPLVVLMHGGPSVMWRDQFVLRWNYHVLASPGYVLVLTNYVGSTGFGEQFAQQIEGDPLRGPGDDINEGADEAVRLFPFIDGTRMAAAGASYGGHLANWLQATTTRYKCLVAHSGLMNLESQWGTSDSIYHREITAKGPVWEQGKVWREQNPIRYAKNFRTPILLTVGEKDFRVPINETIENWSLLQRLKIPSRLIVFPDANHWILRGEDSRFFYSEVLAWLGKYL